MVKRGDTYAMPSVRPGEEFIIVVIKVNTLKRLAKCKQIDFLGGYFDVSFKQLKKMRKL